MKLLSHAKLQIRFKYLCIVTLSFVNAFDDILVIVAYQMHI